MLIRCMKLKLLIILPAILLVVLSMFLFPRFYFNQLEYKARQIFSSIEEARSVADNNIEQRSGREGGEKSAEEINNLSIDITANLNKVDYLINKHESILNRQGNILFLIPSKYKEYYSLKREVFDKYYSALRKFKALKEYEGGIYVVFSKKDKFVQGMRDVGKSVITFDDAQKLIKDYENSKNDVDNYYKDSFVTKEFYDAIIADINTNVALFNLFKDLADKKINVQEFDTRLKVLNSGFSSTTMIDLFNKSYDEVTTIKQKDWTDLYSQADELTYGALDFYDKNRLAYDTLSVLFSKFKKEYPQNVTLKNNEDEDSNSFRVDLNGDGKKETLKLIVSGDEIDSIVLLIAYDENGKELARLPETMPIQVPFSNSAKAYSFDNKKKSKIVSYDFVAGPHSSETMFFGLYEFETGERKILPICLTSDVKSAYDCLFWSGEVGALIVDDFDGDGILEVAETVDEYPKNGTLTKEEEDAINKVFKDGDLNEFEMMTRIAKREKGGRGNRVIWGIYRYNGEYFEEQLGVNYENYYKLVNTYLRNLYPNYPTIMEKADMSNDSLEYNEFMKGFWTKR